MGAAAHAGVAAARKAAAKLEFYAKRGKFGPEAVQRAWYEVSKLEDQTRHDVEIGYLLPEATPSPSVESSLQPTRAPDIQVALIPTYPDVISIPVATLLGLFAGIRIIFRVRPRYCPLIARGIHPCLS